MIPKSGKGTVEVPVIRRTAEAAVVLYYLL